MNKIIIFGNSGSGKSTLATKLCSERNLSHLDLDTITWQPDKPGVRLSFNESLALLSSFIQQNTDWVIEGCYGSLINEASKYCSELIFLNPGVDICLSNNQKRPWEPHKYKSPEDQNEKFSFLQEWVKGYYTRSDEYSYETHKEIFNHFQGIKSEIQL